MSSDEEIIEGTCDCGHGFPFKMVKFFEKESRLSTLEEVEKELEKIKCYADGILSATSFRYCHAKTEKEFQEAGMKIFFDGNKLLQKIQELKQGGKE